MALKITDITARVSKHKDFDNHECVIMGEDPQIGFKAFIGVHNTSRGPAIGGCRYWSRYETENDALTDVLRLSKGMTYKNAVSGLPSGGAKSVIMGKEGTRKPSPEFMQALGRMVDYLGGRYITAEDVGTGVEYMLIARGVTRYVTGLPLSIIAPAFVPKDLAPEDMPDADPSPYTAYGVYQGIKAAAKHVYGTDDLNGLRMTVKGFGHVARPLCEMLHKEGAKLLISDIMPKSRRDIAALYGDEALLAEGEDIMAQPADIYVPCALGGDLNDETIAMLAKAGVKIVSGSANNQLAELSRHGKTMKDAGILYAPDYVINSGGVIAACVQYRWGTDPHPETFPTHSKLLAQVGKVYGTLLDIFERADREDKDTASVADRIAEENFTLPHSGQDDMGQVIGL